MAAQQRFVKVSASKLSSWLDCPRRFLFAYVERRPRGTWAHLTYGNAIHLALRDAYGDDECAGMTAEALVARHWRSDGFRDEAQADHWRREAIALVARYREEGPGRPVAGTERTLGARTDRIVIDARIDRLDRLEPADPGDGTTSAEEELVVVDYKTGLRAPTQADVRGSLALAFYVTAVRQSLRRACRTVELHHLPSGERVSWTHDEASLARHLARAEEIATEMQQAVDTLEGGDDSDAIRDALFPPRPGPLCRFCDALPSCSAGLAVATPAAPWAGLEAASDLAE